jgi:hypothetical protein
MIEPSVIVQALIDPPAEFGDTAKVRVRLSGAEDFVQLLAYYVDEIQFKPEELIGLTVEQAQELHRQKDLAWLQS